MDSVHCIFLSERQGVYEYHYSTSQEDGEETCVLPAVAVEGGSSTSIGGLLHKLVLQQDTPATAANPCGSPRLRADWSMKAFTSHAELSHPAALQTCEIVHSSPLSTIAHESTLWPQQGVSDVR